MFVCRGRTHFSTIDEDDDRIQFPESVYSTTRCLKYSANSGSFALFDLQTKRLISRYSIKIKPQQPINLACSSNSKYGMFFFTCKGENSIYGVRTSDESLLLTKALRVDGSFADFGDKKKMYIKSISCHPSKPYIFIEWSTGCIHIWGFKNLVSEMSKSAGGEGGEGGGDGLDGESDDNILGIAPSDIGDNVSESNASVGAGIERIKRQSSFSSRASSRPGGTTTLLVPRASLVCPASVVRSLEQRYSAQTGSATKGPTDFRPLPTSFAVDNLGRLAAICWDSTVICLYLLTVKPLVGSKPTKGVSSITNDFSLQPFAMSSHFPSGGTIAPGKSLCFHPVEPVLISITRKSSTTGPHVAFPQGRLDDYYLAVHHLLDRELRGICAHGCLHLLEEACKAGNVRLPSNKLALQRTHLPSSLSSQGYVSNCFQLSFTPWSSSAGSSQVALDISLSAHYLALFGCPTGLVSSLSVNPNAFVEDHATNSLQGPLLLQGTLNAAVNVAILQTYDLFTTSCANPSNHKQPFPFLGTIPSSTCAPTDSSWIPLASEDRVADDQVFVAQELIHSSTELFFFAIKGYVLSPTPRDRETDRGSHDISLSSQRCACLGRASDRATVETNSKDNNSPKLQTTFVRCRDICFWEAKIEGGSAELESHTRNFPLILSPIGTSVKLLEPGKPAGLKIWSLPFSMDRMWVLASGIKKKLLYATEFHHGGNSKQLLILSGDGTPEIPLIRASFQLWQEEMALEVIFQPLPAIESPNRPIWCFGSDSHVQEPLLAVRTSHRILILSPQLELLSQLVHQSSEHCERDHTSHGVFARTALDDLVTSIQWVGLGVVYSTTSGAVKFLLPGNALRSNHRTDYAGSCQETWSKVLHITSSDLLNGRLCSLPVHWTMGHVQICAVLSDRLLLAIRNSDGNGVKLMTRPVVPAEPLILSLLLTNPVERGFTSDEARKAYASLWKDTLVRMVEFYFPLAPGLLHQSSSGGALPSTQSTARLCFALGKAFLGSQNREENSFVKSNVNVNIDFSYQESLQSLVELVCGISSSPAEACRSNFGNTPWIASGVKFDVERRSWASRMSNGIGKGGAAEASNAVAMELLSGRQRLQELLADREAYGGSAMVHPKSAVANSVATAAQLVSAQVSSEYVGKRGSEEWKEECARLFADMAGDDRALCAILLSGLGGDLSSELKQLESLRVVRDSAATKDPALCDALDSIFERNQRLRSALSSNASSEELSLLRDQLHQAVTGFLHNQANPSQKTRVTASSLGSAGRRTTLLNSVKLSHHSTNSRASTGLQEIEGRIRKRFSEGQGMLSLGPRHAGPGLAFDLIEDHVGGRTFPELLQAVSNNIAQFGGASNATNPDHHHHPTKSEDWSAAYVDTWMDDVGVGKEWDKVVGYWRFSDVLMPGDEEFMCLGTITPCCVFSDLSKFATPGVGLELFGGVTPAERTVAKLLPSSSPVDSGDSHEKVKSLYDFTVVSSDSSLRTIVGRGGMLDVGPYHTESDRSKLTMEMHFRCVGESWKGDVIVLAQRSTSLPPDLSPDGISASNTARAANVLWSWFIDANGFLCFAFGDANSSNENVLRCDSTLLSRENGSEWKHLAFSLDCSCNVSKADGGNYHWNPGTATIVFYCNGEVIATGGLTIPELDESVMHYGTLSFLPKSIAGCSMTELRVWADVRGAVDVDSQKDQPLALASKRKRLQFRIRGGKKLFGPLGEIFLNGEQEVDLTTSTKRCEHKSLKEWFEHLKGKEGGGDGEHAVGDAKPKAESRLGAPALPLGSTAQKGQATRTSLVPPGSLPRPASIAADLESKRPEISELQKDSAGSPARTVSDHSVNEATPTPSAGIDPPPQLSSAARARRVSIAVMPSPSKVGGLLAPPSAHKPPVNRLSMPPTSAAVLNLQEPPDASGIVGIADEPTRPKESHVAAGHKDSITLEMADPVVRLPLPNVSALQRVFTQPNMVICNDSPSTSAALQISICPLRPSIPNRIVLQFKDIDQRAFHSSVCNGFRHRQNVLDAVPLLAVYSENQISVYTFSIDSQSVYLLAQQPLPQPLIYWSFMGTESLVLITERSVYSWKINPKLGSAEDKLPEQPRPVKLFDRIDVIDSDGNKVVSAVSDASFSEGWVLLSCFHLSSNEKVFCFHHLRSGRAGKVRVAAAALRPGAQAALFARCDGRGKACVIQLEKILWPTTLETQRSFTLELSRTSTEAVVWSADLLEAINPASTSFIFVTGEYIVLLQHLTMLLLHASTGQVLQTLELAAEIKSKTIVSATLDAISSPQSSYLVMMLEDGALSSVELGPIIKAARHKI